ncbi:MAG: TetR/AcrR family transcriptional regulator [Clostridiales bacterium]|nr:TetR/AcrR family transcriptional regulator [Clostridiales bacterium]
MVKNESKYFYTAQLMNQALISLLEKKDIEFITVTEITKKAGVNRSTFYLHYENIYELLEETIRNINEKFINSFNIKVPLKINSPEDAFLITNDFLVPYLNFCKENKKILQIVNRKPQLFQNKESYQKMYNLIFYPAICQFVNDENQRTYFLEFFTQGVSAIVHKWLELDCNTQIEELIDIIKSCINYKN